MSSPFKFDPRPTEEVFERLVATRPGFREAYEADTSDLHQGAAPGLDLSGTLVTGRRGAVRRFSETARNAGYVVVSADEDTRSMTIMFCDLVLAPPEDSSGEETISTISPSGKIIVRMTLGRHRELEESLLATTGFRSVRMIRAEQLIEAIEPVAPVRVSVEGEALKLSASDEIWPRLRRYVEL